MFRIKLKSNKLENRIKELEGHIDKLEDNLIHDPLTGLKTRVFFEDEINKYLEIISQQAENGEPGVSQRKERFGFRNVSVVFFDIDFFKKVNDEHGHDIGDVVLKRVAEVMRESLRTGDTVARWGGEEIIASLLGANEADAAAKAEEIRQKIEGLQFPEAPGLSITISAGVASSKSDMNLSELVKKADEALYKAKGSGRNKVIIFSKMGESVAIAA